MKAHVLLFGAVSLMSFSKAAAQIPNGGFENWTSVDGHLDPDDWITGNDGTSELGMSLCVQGSPGAVGSYYAKITSQLVPNSPSPILILGTLESGDLNGAVGFPYTERPAALNGSIQYDLQPGDQGAIVVNFTLNGNAIGYGLSLLTGAQSGWFNFSIPMTFLDGTTYPDSADITIVTGSSTDVSGAGSTISVDNLSFGALTGAGTGGGAGAGIQEAQPSVGLQVYPTLTSDVLNVAADRPLAQVDILDMTGRSLMHQGTNADNIALDVSDLNTGRYLVQVYLRDGRRLVRSFVKQ